VDNTSSLDIQVHLAPASQPSTHSMFFPGLDSPLTARQQLIPCGMHPHTRGK
jgi:hypothetical protein